VTRRARERFRVYTDDELLLDPDVWLSDSPAPRRADRRRRRIAGAALLIGAVGSVVGVAGARLFASARHSRAARAPIARAPSPTIVASSVRPRRAVELVPAASGRAIRASARAVSPRSSAVRHAASFRRPPASLAPPALRLRSSGWPILHRPAAIDVSVTDTRSGPSAPVEEPTAVAPPPLPEPTREGGEFGFER
jgi:hypothetical protein